MAEYDPLERFARETTQQVLAPDFDALVTVSKRRRRATYLAAGCVSAAVVGIVAFGFQAVGDDQGAPVGPGPTTPRVSHPITTPTTPSTTSQHHAPGPRAIVDQATDGPAHLAVSSDDTNVEATAWQVCRSHTCGQYLGAIAVTSDGFEHVHYISVSPFTELRWLSGDTFVTQLRSGQVSTVSADGKVTAIPITETASPLRDGEVLFLAGGGQKPPGRRYLAVDAAGTSAHPIALPYTSQTYVSLTQTGARSLWGVALGDSFALISSPDGGGTWRPPYAPTRFGQIDPLDSVAPDLLAALPAGDDDSRSAQTLYRSSDAGASWQVIHPAQFADMGAGWAVVLADGNLLITVSPYDGSSPARLYESDSAAWQHFHVVHPTGGLPQGYLLTATLDSDGTTSLWLNGTEGLLDSIDGGRTWSTARAR